MSNKYEELHQAIMVDFCNHMLAQTDDIEYIDDYLLHLYTEAGVAVSSVINGPSNDMLVNGWDGYRTTPKGNKFLGLSTDCDPSLASVCVAIVLSPTTGHVVPFMPINGNVFKDIQTSASDGHRWEEASTGKTHDVYKMMTDVDDFIESGAPDPSSREDDPVYVWQDGVFTTMAPEGSDYSVDEYEDSDEDDDDYQELDEDPILAANGVPKKLADILRKAVSNGTQITGVGPGGSLSDITGLFGDSTPESPKADPLNGYPLKDYTIDLSEACTTHIRKQAERLNRIMGIDVDESIESIQQNITKAFIGVFHQTLQAKDQNESMDIDQFYTDNLYGDRFYTGKVEDGKVYSDLNSPVKYSDTVIAKEVLDLIHKNI